MQANARKKWQFKAKPTWHHFERKKSIGSDQKKNRSLKERVHDLENQYAN
jgi:hypothetical protein